MRRVELALICLLLWAASSHAGEALITKVRGSNLTIDTGAESGLVEGLAVTIVRPPGEAVIHPITGEDLGAPEVEIGTGEISKIANRAANVRIAPELLLPVRPGDIVRFITPEEEMIMGQERSMMRAEKNEDDHQSFSQGISQLTKSIQKVQGRIGGLERMMKRVERVEEGFKVQLRGINTDINIMKDDIKDLKESVTLMGTVPIEGLGEDGEPVEGGLSLEREEDVAQLKEIVRTVLSEEELSPSLPPLDPSDLGLPDDGDLEVGEEGEEEEPFYYSLWFMIGLAVLGLLGLGLAFYLWKMGGSEDKEDEEEEIEEDDDLVMDNDLDLDDDLELDEMEDDIIVEETS